jgi:hypothetical protein
MDSYTITIAPNDDSGAATRLVIDTSGDQVRITDVHLHAPQGLSSGHIPSVDFDLLLQAVTGTVTASNGHSVHGPTALSATDGTPALEAAAATEPAEPSAAPAAPQSRRRQATPQPAVTAAPRPARTRTAKATSAEEAPAPRRSKRDATTARTVEQSPAKASRKAAAKTPPAPARKRTATPATAWAKSQTPAKRTRAATATAESPTSGRVYRRTPDDLAAVFARVETVAGVAEHYQVPRYTAQGWVSRLRATA